MNDKKPLMDYRRVQKLQTPLLLTGALLSGVGTSVSVPLVILGIAIMLFAIVIGVLYYRCLLPPLRQGAECAGRGARAQHNCPRLC